MLHIGLSSGGRGGYNFVRGEGGYMVFRSDIDPDRASALFRGLPLIM
jgi:hypothetical protein